MDKKKQDGMEGMETLGRGGKTVRNRKRCITRNRKGSNRAFQKGNRKGAERDIKIA